MWRSAHRLDRSLKLLVRLAALLALGSRTVVLLGWHLDVVGLTRVVPGLDPIRYATAIGTVSVSAGLLLLTFERRRLALPLALLAAALGVASLAEHILGHSVGIDWAALQPALTGTMPVEALIPPNSALAFVLSGAYLIIACLPPQRLRPLALGLLGAIVMGIAGTALIGYLSGVETAFAWNQVTGMGTQTAVGFLVLALGFMAYPVAAERRLPNWTALAAGALLLTLGFGLWWALREREEAQIRALVAARTQQVVDEISAAFEAGTEAMDRMSARWETRGGTSQVEWQADAALYVAYEDGYRAMKWADEQLIVRWVVPLAGNREQLDMDLRSNLSGREALQRALDTGATALSEPTALRDGGLGIELYAPLYLDGVFDGMLVVSLDADRLLSSLLSAEVSREVSIALLDDGQQFFGPERSSSPYRSERELRVLNQTWQLEVWPRDPLLDAATTAIPAIALTMGAVTAILLPLTILFAQRSMLRADVLEHTVEERTAELRETVAALAESESKYVQLYENAPDMFMSIDAVYATVIECNRTLADTIGVGRDEIIGRPVAELYHPDCQSSLQQSFAHLLRTGEAQDTSLELLRSDGSTLAVMVNYSAIRDSGGRILYGSAVIRDVSALQATERERDRLLAAERDQRRIAESLARVALALSATLDLDSLVELICKESVALFEVGAAFVWLVEGDQLVGRAGYGSGREHFIGTAVSLNDWSTLGVRVIRDRRPIYVNHARSTEGANRRLVELFGVESILGVPLMKGLRPIGALMILDTQDPERFGQEDLSMAAVLGSHVSVAVENARLYEQERALAQMKDDFIAHVSHELRTPLHTLRGFIQLLRSGKVKEENMERDLLGRAAHDADRLTEQVSELLDAAQIDATGLRLRYEDVDVGSIVQQTIESIQIIANDRGVRLRNRVPPEGLVIRSEERRLRQVVRNLVENAIQYSESHSEVMVESVQEAGELRLMVRDQGPGIPPQAMERLFERFYQVDGSGRREKGGVGLGLYITRMIVEAHGGRIEVDSTLGEGSTFRAVLPLKQAEPAIEDGRL